MKTQESARVFTMEARHDNSSSPTHNNTTVKIVPTLQTMLEWGVLGAPGV